MWDRGHRQGKKGRGREKGSGERGGRRGDRKTHKEGECGGGGRGRRNEEERNILRLVQYRIHVNKTELVERDLLRRTRLPGQFYTSTDILH